MLVLTRKYNQGIMIGDSVEIVVVEIKGDQVKLGIKAPRSVKVFRTEVYREIQEENKLASSSSVGTERLEDLKKLIAEARPAE